MAGHEDACNASDRSIPDISEIENIHKNGCDLSWQPCKDTGGVPLKHYVIERQDMSVRGGWSEVGTTKDLNIKVDGLTPKKEYKFRVRAVNERGNSEPLLAAKSIIAKDPYGTKIIINFLFFSPDQ